MNTSQQNHQTKRDGTDRAGFHDDSKVDPEEAARQYEQAFKMHFGDEAFQKKQEYYKT